MAFIRNDDIEGMNGNRQLVSIFVGCFTLCPEHTGCVTTKNVHCHSLDRTDVDKRVAQLWIGQVILWKNRRIKLFIFAKIRLLKTL